MNKDLIAVALLPHHLDHLAPLCELLQMPVMITDVRLAKEARKFHPNLHVRLFETTKKKQIEIMKEAVMKGELNERAVFYSSLFPREALVDIFSSRSDKPRVVYCPHGFSEKQHAWPLGATKQDISLHHGQFALDQIRDLGGTSTQNIWIRTGNLRRQYYLKHKEHLDNCARSRLPPLHSARTVLYAPTWADDIATTSFGSANRLVQEFARNGWNVLIKLHPLLRRFSQSAEIKATLRSFPNTFIIPHKSLVLPYLEHADVYLGDMSSVAYDFLYYEKPMAFLNETEGTDADHASTKLFACGTVVQRAEFNAILEVLKGDTGNQTLRNTRKIRLRTYVYDETLDRQQVADAIRTGLDGPAPRWMSD